MLAVIFVLFSIITIVSADPVAMPPVPSSGDPLALVQNFGWNNWNVGPVSVGGQYDSMLGAIFNAHYAQAFGNNWALGFIGEYGPNQYRVNGTVGYTSSNASAYWNNDAGSCSSTTGRLYCVSQ